MERHPTALEATKQTTNDITTKTNLTYYSNLKTKTNILCFKTHVFSRCKGTTYFPNKLYVLFHGFYFLYHHSQNTHFFTFFIVVTHLTTNYFCVFPKKKTPPVLIFCPQGADSKSVPFGLAVRKDGLNVTIKEKIAIGTCLLKKLLKNLFISQKNLTFAAISVYNPNVNHEYGERT